MVGKHILTSLNLKENLTAQANIMPCLHVEAKGT